MGDAGRAGTDHAQVGVQGLTVRQFLGIEHHRKEGDGPGVFMVWAHDTGSYSLVGDAVHTRSVRFGTECGLWSTLY